MRMAWITDPHLDHASEPVRQAFYRTLEALDVDRFLVSGDITEAVDIEHYLGEIADAAGGRPVDFVLGNHDFYGAAVAMHRDRVTTLARTLRGRGRPVRYLSIEEHPITLTSRTALVGHDGWGDCQAGNWRDSRIRLRDVERIADLNFSRATSGRFGPLDVMRRLGQEAASHLGRLVAAAATKYENVFVATHVPPFAEAAWRDGRMGDDDWLPFTVCKAVGDALLQTASVFPDRTFHVFCGHTHSGGIYRALPNLTVHTAGATYHDPEVASVFDVP